MFEDLILSVAAMINPPSAEWFEQTAALEPSQVIEISAENPWNAVTLFSRDYSGLPEIEYQNTDGVWHEWHPAEREDGHAENALDLIIFPEVQTHLRVKSEKSAEIVLHFFNTTVPGEDFLAQWEENSEEFLDSALPSSFGTNGQVPKFYSRAAWGADESLREQGFFQKIFSRVGSRWFTKEAKAVDPQYRPVIKTTKSEAGKSLFWPIAESPRIFKFVIHHTGEAVQKRRRLSPKATMRAIYQYHTVTRGWGDIGYNYVIDKQGNIYEGRAGGPKSVGAHTAYHNIGSIGISLMGNFQHEEPTAAQIDVASLLIADHAKRFDVNPEIRSSFLGKNSHNISGHRDVARIGHGTACPGIHLVKKLPTIRKKSAEFLEALKKFEKDGVLTTRDFLGKSKNAPQIFADQKFQRPEKRAPVALAQSTQNRLVIPRGKTQTVTVELRNQSKLTWPIGSEVEFRDLPEGLIASKLRLLQPTSVNKTGIFRGKIQVQTTPNGQYDLSVWPKFLEKNYFANQIEKASLSFPLQVSGSTALASQSFSSVKKPQTKTSNTSQFSQFFRANSFKSAAEKSAASAAAFAKKAENLVKIKLAGFDKSYAEIVSTKPFQLISNGKILRTVAAFEPLKFQSKRENFRGKLYVQDRVGQLTAVGNVALRGNENIFTIKNYSHPDFGYGITKYNKFRGNLLLRSTNTGKIQLVNELPLEEYLWGIAEETSAEPDEKRKAILILARSYAYVYSQERRKFGTNEYDLEDDPKSSQLYLGYDWEKRHVTQKQLVKETEGVMLSFNGKPVIGPYFTQSSGESSAQWSRQYPWTKSQKLPFDEGLPAKGHGVGLSGNTARELANQGRKSAEILDYFYEGTVVKKIY